MTKNLSIMGKDYTMLNGIRRVLQILSVRKELLTKYQEQLFSSSLQ